MLLAANGVWAYDFKVGVVYYNITSNTAPYTVEVTSSLYQNSYSGTVTIPSTVSHSGRTYSVTSIGSYAFRGSTGLTSVTIPNSITSIGHWAFRGCTGLTSVTIPNSVTSIRESVFEDCTNLNSINVSAGNARFSSSNGILFSYAFDTLFCYPEGKIGTSYSIPNTVNCIGDYAFFKCTRLLTITIPNNVVSIGTCAFDNTGLTSISIPSSITSIGDYAFRRCQNLPSIIVDSNNTHFKSNNGVLFNYALDTLICYPAGKVGTSYSIPNSVKYIQREAFFNCSSLTQITIPNSVISIGSTAFVYCSGLTSVSIGNSVDTIRRYTFGEDSLLTSITFYKVNTVIASDAFYGVSTSIPVHVPCGATSWYRNQLGTFSNFVEFMAYSYSAVSQDTTMGHVTTDTVPTCSNNVAWTVTATANSGYSFSHWSDGDSNAHRTLTLTQDTILTAYFSPNTYNVIVLSNDTTKGSVSGSGRFAYMTQDTIIATANHGYSFSHWSDGDTTNPRIITITQDTSFTAFYNFNYYNVAVSSNDTTKGSVSGSGRFAYMTQDTILATANYGYSFSHWSDGDTTNPRVITVTQDTSFTAFYDFNYYNVAVSSNDITQGSVTGSGHFAYLSQDTLIATPNTGYTFSRWSDGDTTNPRIITITQDTAIIAYFTQTTPQPWYNFVVVSEDTNKGTVQIVTQPTQANPQAIIVALPNTGYTFTRWSDGNTQNPRTLTVTQDTILIAFFTSNQGIAETENDNISIRTANGHILLEGVGIERVYVSDVLGRVIYNATVNERAEIAVRNCGVYFVKVGNRPAQKVVVVR